MWWAAVALAGTRDELLRLEAQGPDLSVACSSVDQLITLMTRLDQRPETERVPFPDEARALFDPGSESRVMSPNSPLSIAAWNLAFSGPQEDVAFVATFATPLDTDGLASEMASKLGETVQAQGESRVLLDAATGAPDVSIVVDGGIATLRAGPPAPPAVDPDLRVARALVEAPGCSFVAHVPASEKVPAGVVGLQVPFAAGEPLRFALVGAGMEPVSTVRSVARPIPTTARTPTAVLVFRDDVRSLELEQWFDDPKQLRAANWLRRKLPIEGLTAAVFGGDGTHPADVVGDVALDPRWSARKVARRARSVLNKVSKAKPQVQVEKLSATEFVVRIPRQTLFAAEEGRLRIASDPAMLAEIDRREGEPWLVADAAQRAERSDLFVQMDLGQVPLLGLPQPTVASFGLAWTADGVATGELLVPITLDQLVAFGERASRLRPVKPRASP